jgi:molybdate transport system ATP-binding protein
MKRKSLLMVKDIEVQLSGKTVINQVSFDVHEGECLAIIGPNGSGKSTLVKALGGNFFSKGSIDFLSKDGCDPYIVTITQQHHFKNLSNTNSFYYQQRFNSYDAGDSLSVYNALLNLGAGKDAIMETLELTGMSHTLNNPLIQLSNGEHKRFQLAKAILQKADWLLMDSPYTGLDVAARNLLNTLIDKLIAGGMNVLLVTSPHDMPKSVTHVVLLEKGELKEKLSINDFGIHKRNINRLKKHALQNFNAFEAIDTLYDHPNFSVAIQMVDANVIYGNRKILANINWKVNKGECWNISGHNGSGKSTLLSLVTGDNPQAFANEIYLFDRKKGSGESIWDIKRKIGYVSPELHHYFDSGISCFEIVASGLFDTVGLFRQLSEEQKSVVNKWMKLLKLEDSHKRLFSQLSNGEQRLILLARALVKNPPLLILDEPCQGLDQEMSAWFISLINDICIRMKKTLVYVSHYEEEIPACVKFTLKLEQGRIAA